jgi:AAA family ATP:ADP antiporter
LPLAALLLLGGVFCIYQLRQWVRQHDEDSGTDTVESSKAMGGGAFEGVRLVFITPYFGAIAFALAMATFMGVVAYNFMQELASVAFPATDRRTQVFSWIDLATNAGSFIGQIILVKHSVKKLGIGATLALLPIVSIIGFALLAMNPIFAIMAGLVIFRRSLAFGFSKPASDMLYAVVTAEEKYKVKSFVETAIFRSGDALAAWTIVLSGIGISAIAVVCIPIAAVWAAMSFFIGREYNRRAESPPTLESA